jgi:hypothetical protein
LASAAAVIAATATAVVPMSLSHASQAKPSLRLVTAVRSVEADRFGASPDLYVPEWVDVAATHGAFEIDAARRHGRVRLEQVRRNGSTVSNVRYIHTPTRATFATGMPGFFDLTLTDSTGKVAVRAHPDFCPTVGYDAQRVTPNSADNPTYPGSCGDALTKATVWGIDAGWAEPQYFDLTAAPDAVPDGTYTLTVAVAASYARQLGIPVADRSASVALTLVTQSDGCTAICPARASAQRSPSSSTQLPRRAPFLPAAADPGGLPDLVALPAHGLGIHHDNKSGKDYLGFGATIWNAGPGTFDVEGFRVGGRPTMHARQFIYRNGHSVQSMSIGRFEFDNRRGHHHWHLEDVARYDLLNAQQDRVVRSDKQSFCLAPTDPINLTKPGALWNPYTIGLESSCPTDQSLWLRETLPVGWGDTYVQRKGGQSFNITNLPNGRYLIRIATNPFGRIHETTRSNDTALLAIELGGVPGARTLTKLGPVQ